jgi:hypothetical protein
MKGTVIHGHARKGRRSPEFRTWESIQTRCYCPSQDNWGRYGGRGVTVCDRWRFGEGGKSGFQCFLEDMSPKPSPKYQIDRIDPTGPYAPWNCRWVTLVDQANNRRNNRRITIGDRTQTTAQWATELGMRKATFWARVKSGWAPPRRSSPLSA